MGDKSAIEWTDATWPCVQGCDPLSQGCVHCYAVPLLWRMMHNPDLKISGPLQGLVEKHINAAGEEILRFTGKVALRADRLTWPLSWKAPRMIFVPSHGDLFHKDVPDSFIDRVFAVMALSPQHTFQVLTKRAERMREYMLERWQPAPAQSFKIGADNFDLPAETKGNDRHGKIVEVIQELTDDLGIADRFFDPDNEELWTAEGSSKALRFKWPLPNVWLGVSAEDQANADARIPHLLATPAAIRFVSLEPLLGPIDLTRIHHQLAGESFQTVNALYRKDSLNKGAPAPGLDWIIVGGESGKGARPMHPDWARSLHDQCAAADVAFFFKQWGEWLPGHHYTDELKAFDSDLHQSRFDCMDWNGDEAFETEGLAGWDDLGDHAMWRVGRKRAGRLLDGVEHSAFPQVRA